MKLTSCVARRALLQQALLITLVDLALSNASNNPNRNLSTQQVAPTKHLNNNNNNLTAALKTQPTLNESLDAGYELSRIAEPVNRFKIEKIKNRGRQKVNARKGRKTTASSLNTELTDDNNQDTDTNNDGDQLAPVVSQEGIAQAKRVARNVQRKMDFVSGRINQLDSRIAEDHQAASNSTPVYGEYSTPYNGDIDNIESSSMREFGSSDKATDLPSAIVSSPSSGSVINSNIEAPQSQTSDPIWMSPHNDGDEQENSNRLANQQQTSNILRAANESSSHVTKWNSAIIKSVIPGRHDLSSSSSEHSNSNSIGSNNDLIHNNENRQHDIDPSGESLNFEDNNSENSESQAPVINKTNKPSLLKHTHYSDLDVVTKPSSHALTGSLSNNVDQIDNLGFENALISGDNIQSSSSNNYNNNNLTLARYSTMLNSGSTPEASSLSMLPPEWKANQGLGTYFQDLNSKNHNNHNKEPHQITDSVVNKNRGAAFKPAPPLRGSTSRSGGKFQNMTILNSDNDLLNSFSNQQQQHHQPIKIIPTPSMATQALTTTTTTSTTTKKPEMTANSRKQPSSVHTYSASSYGRNSKDSNGPRAVNIQPVPLPDNYDKNQDSYSDNYVAATVARNDSANYMNQFQSPIYWPEFASSYSSTNEKSNNNINLNSNDMTNSSPVSKMLASAATNNNRYPSDSGAESDTVQAGGHKFVDVEYSPNNLANDKKFNFNIELNNDDRQQLNRLTRTNLNRQNNQQQQQDYQIGDIYNSIMRRQNNVPDNKNTFSGFGTKSGSNSDDLLAANNSSDLKHRSSSNSDESALNYPNMDSLSYSQNGNNDQMNPQNGYSDSSQASSGVYSNPSESSPDYGDTQTSYARSPNHRNLPSFAQTSNSLFISPNQMNSGITSSSNLALQPHQQQLDAASLYSLANDAAPGNGVSLDNSLQYGYQPVSNIGSQRNQEQAGDASEVNSRANLLTSSDFLEQTPDQSSSAYDPRLLYAAALAARNPANNYYQASATNSQDFMQPAATNNQNSIRQQQLTAAILAKNPTLSANDINSLIQRYLQQQQQQRLLSSQLQQQQQQQQHKQINAYQSESTGFLPGYSSRDQVIYRRYSPDSGVVSSGGPYMGARSLSSGASVTETGQASDLVPYSSPSQYQPVYSRAGVETIRALRDTNSAYYQAALAAAASATARANLPVQQQIDQQSSLMSVTSPLLSQQVSSQQQQHLQQQQYALGGSNNNYSSGGGSLYATSAMNSPAFAAYAADAVAASQHLKPIATAPAPASPPATSIGLANGNQQLQQNTQLQQQQQQQQYSTSAPYKKSYLNSLFRPTASSRYYYTPTILSPISYASPASLHSLYAPASLASATEQMQTQLTGLPQMYAAASNPYIQHPSLSGVSFADQAQQYQAFAAANGLSPQYMTDPDMAESSMVPTDTSNTFVDASSGQASQSNGGTSSDDNSSNNNSGSVSKSSKSMGPWSNIATLMLGILPLGILMSYFMPAVTIAGRKKRELELSGRNFSELLKWRPPSGVLNALMSGASGNQEVSGAAKASAIISELISSISPGTKQLYSSVVDNIGQQQQQYNKRRSLSEPSRTSSSPGKGSWEKSIPQQQTSPTSSSTSTVSSVKSNYHHSSDLNSPTRTADTYLDSNDSVNSTASTTLSSPSSSTTPLSSSQQQLWSQANNNSATSGVKGKLKKAMNALNNFIVAASANMKRKHRSSMIENHWSIPSMIKSSLKLDNLFNVQELKRQLVEKAKEIQLSQSQMAQQQYSLLGRHQSAPVEYPTPFSQRTASNNIFFANNKPVFGQNQQQNLSSLSKTNEQLNVNKTTTSPPQQVSLGAIISNSTTPQVSTVTDLSEDVTASSQLERPSVSNKVQYQSIPQEMAALQDSPRVSIISSKSILITDPANNSNKQVELQPVVSLKNDKAADVNNSTRHHLEICLNQFLCRLTVKLSKSLKNTYVTSAQANFALENRQSRNASTQITPDHVERLTKKYINQLVEQIETENPSLRLNSKMHSDNNNESDDESMQHWNNSRQHENPLDALYKNAMKNQCSIMYNCVELLQLEKTLSKMKLKLS